MNGSTISLLVVAAVLLFWAVGAYNRLVVLRNGIGRAYAAVDTRLREREPLLRQWLAALRPAMGHAPQLVEAVDAACTQLGAACDAVRNRPSAARAVASMRLAEETLAGARSRLDTELAARPELLGAMGAAMLREEIDSIDGVLGFARHQFNEATEAYNRAVREFPTWLLAALFNFRSAGSL